VNPAPAKRPADGALDYWLRQQLSADVNYLSTALPHQVPKRTKAPDGKQPQQANRRRPLRFSRFLENDDDPMSVFVTPTEEISTQLKELDWTVTTRKWGKKSALDFSMPCPDGIAESSEGIGQSAKEQFQEAMGSFLGSNFNGDLRAQLIRSLGKAVERFEKETQFTLSSEHEGKGEKTSSLTILRNVSEY
jgi:hypothetical protein